VGQVDLAPSSRLDYVRIQQRDSAHLGTNRLTARLEQNANFHHCAFDFGSAMSRNEIVATIAGPGAEANLHGLYLSDRQQHIDNHLAVIHDVGPANSLQDYRGILTGRSRCVFNGKAKVMQGADGTDANQSNHNLLLSDTAEIDTKPELEIYADDVKCSHGATVGQLDENAIFYLRSRGLSRNDARQILTRAFATKVLKNLPVDESRAYVSKALEQRLTALTDDISAHGGGQ
jgi:Fe-S cluster assembly protein SufD